MARGDEDRNFEELRGKERENVDYSVTVCTVAGSKVAIVPPHGGGIEPLTAELAVSIASNDHDLYALRGLKNEGNEVLHITSHRFDDERALALIAPCGKVITIHGQNGDAQAIQVGGRDAALRSRVHEALCSNGRIGGTQQPDRSLSTPTFTVEINAGSRQLPLIAVSGRA